MRREMKMLEMHLGSLRHVIEAGTAEDVRDYKALVQMSLDNYICAKTVAFSRFGMNPSRELVLSDDLIREAQQHAKRVRKLKVVAEVSV